MRPGLRQHLRAAAEPQRVAGNCRRLIVLAWIGLLLPAVLPSEGLPEWILWLAFLARTLALHIGLWLLPIVGLAFWARAHRSALIGLGLALYLLVPAGLAALPRTESEVVPHLRVLSYNAWDARNDQLLVAARALAASGADLICIQEYRPEFDRLLVPLLKESHPYQVRDPATHYYGSAIFSRVPMQGRQERMMEGLPNTAYTVAELRVQGQRLRLRNLHLFHHGRGQREQMRELLVMLGEWPRHEILLGDFNFTQYARAHADLAGRGMRDALEHGGAGLKTTWPRNRFLSWPFWPGFRIDHVYLGAGIAVVDAGVADLGRSDHRMIWADVVIRDAED